MDIRDRLVFLLRGIFIHVCHRGRFGECSTVHYLSPSRGRPYLLPSSQKHSRLDRREWICLSDRNVQQHDARSSGRVRRGLRQISDWLIENRKLRFILSGSSARKLRRGHANLLGGRALRFELFGLVSRELENESYPTPS